MIERDVQNKIIRTISKQDANAFIYKPPDVRKCPRCGTPVLAGGKRPCDLIIIPTRKVVLHSYSYLYRYANVSHSMDDYDFCLRPFEVAFIEVKYHAHTPKDVVQCALKKLTAAQKAMLNDLRHCHMNVAVAIQCKNKLHLLSIGQLDQYERHNRQQN